MHHAIPSAATGLVIVCPPHNRANVSRSAREAPRCDRRPPGSPSVPHKPGRHDYLGLCQIVGRRGFRFARPACLVDGPYAWGSADGRTWSGTTSTGVVARCSSLLVVDPSDPASPAPRPSTTIKPASDSRAASSKIWTGWPPEQVVLYSMPSARMPSAACSSSAVYGWQAHPSTSGSAHQGRSALRTRVRPKGC
jgi:hypothetical protein